MQAGIDSLLVFPEFCQWLGIWLFASLHPGRERRDFWRKNHKEGDPAFDLGKHGMSYKRFEVIRRHLTISEAPTGPRLDEDPMSEFSDYLKAWHQNMREVYKPSYLVCVDESMLKWLTRWTIPFWMFVSRKPNPFGQEYHDLADGLTKIIFSIELFSKLAPVAVCAKNVYRAGQLSVLMILFRETLHTSRKCARSSCDFAIWLACSRRTAS